MNITAVGMMSGTSLDGVDLALCRFDQINEKWSYQIIKARTFTYSEEWIHKLQNAANLGSNDFLLLHNEYGRYIGELVNQFLAGEVEPDLICSHGHTIFHQPDKKFTFQLGSSASIAASTHLTTIHDFRSLDVALGGQGAPLVPIGDKLLFHEYEYCLNLGGFANISFEQNGTRIAYDICPVNLVLNYLAAERKLSFDEDGVIGSAGKINDKLLNALNEMDFYRLKNPKSLGREWVEKWIFPLLRNSQLSIEDQSATFYEHIADQISRNIAKPGKILSTGGGSKNVFLINKLKKKINNEIYIPDKMLVDFKEALIFAFLGVLVWNRQINCLSSVTGAVEDSISGSIILIPGKNKIVI
jgi:anhydro-N-acetylmuramic acid kinase